MSDHLWRFRGIVFRLGRQLSGSDAREVSYHDCYFCERCLAMRTVPINFTHDSHQAVVFDATPAPDDRGYKICGA